MIEHRIIERMISLLRNELEKIESDKDITHLFIDTAVDVIRIYADKTHHGKEEDILFRELGKKELATEHKKIMNELIEEHKMGRKLTGELVRAENSYLDGDEASLNTIVAKIEWLVDFYPKHIDKEDSRFFRPVMAYFSEEEQEGLLLEGRAYDRKMIHRKYDSVVSDVEKERDMPPPRRSKKWLDYV